MAKPIPWETIRIVLLDMDGTLLDLFFDDHFFREVVPRAYADKQGISFDQAVEEVFATYKTAQGTLAWYDVDHWSRTLDLDIPDLKRQMAHGIALRREALHFLDFVADRGIPMHLVTNAHPMPLSLKLERTGLAPRFASIVSSHTLGHPKEDAAFWEILRRRLDFLPETALFVDDSEAVLEAARAFGVGWIRHVAHPNSQRPPAFSNRFDSILDLRELFHGAMNRNQDNLPSNDAEFA